MHPACWTSRRISGSWRLSASLRRFCSLNDSGSTIYALSTPPGRGAVAIIRVSGADSQNVYRKLSRRKSIEHRKPVLTRLKSPSSNAILDEALALFFKGPRSYTGEDVLELHVHGGNAVVRAVLDSIKELHSPDAPIKYAEPGEFTKRAFHNNRMDLTQVEGIRDIIDAETEFQREAAVSSASGHTAVLYESWRSALVNEAARMTALIDFADDNAEIESSANDLLAEIRMATASLLKVVSEHLDKVQRSELIRSGIQMNLLGSPNAGKSSLLNLLARREACIVSEIPGTTRDILEVSMDMSGFKAMLVDTAGLRDLSKSEEQSAIEAEGIRRARDRFRESNVIIAVIPVVGGRVHISHEVKKELAELALMSSKHIVVAVNKTDLLDGLVDLREVKSECGRLLNVPEENIIPMSCKSEDGVQDLVDKLSGLCETITMMGGGDSGPPIGASQRIRDLLESDVKSGLEEFLYCIDTDIVLALAELHRAIEGIGKITGRSVGVEEILGVVFGNFCIGK